ncbi:MAG: RNA polymerase subunit sigma-70, partial [Gemmatimonadetes bacterium]|nr:RNA polymerase subunit sigma-70 [Gemmatimonadota bacterium]
RGARAVAELFNGRAQAARPARVDGAPAIAVVLGGQLRIVLLLAIDDGKIREIAAVADPARIAEMDVTLLDS